MKNERQPGGSPAIGGVSANEKINNKCEHIGCQMQARRSFPVRKATCFVTSLIVGSPLGDRGKTTTNDNKFNLMNTLSRSQIIDNQAKSSQATATPTVKIRSMTKTATNAINEYAKTKYTTMTSLFIACNMQVFRFTFAAI
jgi:hypothetical protein